MTTHEQQTPKVCFISRGFGVSSYGILPAGFGEHKYRVNIPDHGSPTMQGATPPREYLAAINEYERKRHEFHAWPELLGPKPAFREPCPGFGFAPCCSISPYGTFIK